MASWMVHLRIADLLLDKLQDLDETAFIVGNIAPDSGVPSDDWSYYVPSSKVSHFHDENKKVQIQPYMDLYFGEAVHKNYSRKQFSFYLGYLTHLMADVCWQNQISDPCIEAHSAEAAQDRNAFVWKMKGDWYDLDFLFLSKNPNFRAFERYKNAVGFQNTYMDIFATDAFDNRRKYITGFYSQKKENLDRVYPYLTEERMNRFVTDTAEAVFTDSRFLHAEKFSPSCTK